MNALLLAAGMGTRLRPLTEHTPKCLVKIDGRPLLDIWLGDLSDAGIEDFLVNTHYLAPIVENHISAHRLHGRIGVVREQELLGTAGTVMTNRDFFLRGTTLVGHADNLCLCRWSDFFAAHRNRRANTLMTMMTFETPSPSECGIVETDVDGIVRGFHEKVPDPPGNLANAAVYLFEPEMIDFITSLGAGVNDLSTQVLPHLSGRIQTWQNRETLIDIGTPERLEMARARLPSSTSH